MAPPGSTRSSTGLADMSWTSSLFDNLGGQASQAGAEGGAEGVAEGGAQSGSHFGGIMTQLPCASKPLSCHVQHSEECTVFKPLMGQQKQQQPDFLVIPPSHTHAIYEIFHSISNRLSTHLLNSYSTEY